MQGPATPVWLCEEPELAALLHAVLDRFDRLPSLARQRAVQLPAEQHLPVLARADAVADQVWGLVGELQRLGALTVRHGRRGPFDPDWKGAKLAFAADSEPLLRAWLQRDVVTPELQHWRAAVQQHAHAFTAGSAPLLARRVALEGRSSEAIAAAFASIAGVRGPLTLRQLSAQVFWGDSKVLDDRGELIAALFPQLVIRTRAIVVAVHLPSVCHGVLFIENQDTYTQACSGCLPQAAQLALVFAAGFRSSAERVRLRDGVLLHYSGDLEAPARQRFESWWFAHAPAPGPCWFWGDLDFSGMQILKTLRERFDDIAAWQPGYAPMLAALHANGGYSEGARHRGQVDPVSTGCSYADAVLLPAIRALGQLDQEFFRDAQLRESR